MAATWRWYNDVLGAPRFVCAPMVRASELAFRLLTRELGCDLTFSPMLHATELVAAAAAAPPGTDITTAFLDTSPIDRPLIVQLCAMIQPRSPPQSSSSNTAAMASTSISAARSAVLKSVVLEPTCSSSPTPLCRSCAPWLQRPAFQSRARFVSCHRLTTRLRWPKGTFDVTPLHAELYAV